MQREALLAIGELPEADGAIGVTDGIDVYPEMEQKTLSIKGRLRRPGASEWVPLLIETEFAFWHTTALPDVDSEAVTISLYRDLPRLFDEVDFGAWTVRKLESRVTENLVRHTTIEVHEIR